MFFQQPARSVEFHFDLDLLEAQTGAHQYFANEINIPAAFIIHAQVIIQIDLACNYFTAAIAPDGE
jgi:hypothetical protein